ncbi:MAG TPA: hypothetical protein DD640_04455 [Clostridiales bacterium]|nr:hypothetical protein [Clostridiales bacterium]
MSQAFTDIILEKNDGYALCYRSDKMVFEEVWTGGRYVTAGCNASGFALASNPLSRPPRLNPDDFPLPQAFQLELDGCSLGYEWEWQGFAKTVTARGLQGTVTLASKLLPVTVQVHTLLDGTQVFSRWLEITNNTGRNLNLSRLAILSGGLQSLDRWQSYLRAGDPLYRLGYMEHSHWGMEGGFAWHDLPSAGYSVAGRFRRDRHRHPMFALENLATGEFFICQLGWSGGYAFDFDLDADCGVADSHNIARLSFAVRLDAPAPMRILAPGETLATPEVHFGLTFGGLDEAVNQMHAHLRRSVFLPPARGKHCWVETGIGPEFYMHREATLQAVANAAAIGAEIFFIDAGWYLPPDQEDQWWLKAGDWQYNPDRYPNGLREIRDAVKAQGMLFGLWMDAERIGKDSQAYASHPDFLATAYDGQENGAQILDLANPAAAAWMEEQIARVIEDNGCDFFRLDYNAGYPSYLTRTCRDGIWENDFLRYYQALYGIYDRLRRRFPDVIFENCAGGGGRTDVGLTRYFNHTWVTDWQKAPRSFAITNGMTLALPPEHVDRLVGGQGGYLTGSLEFQLRLLLFVQPTLSVGTPFGEETNTNQLEFIRHSVSLYKNFIRAFLPEARVYHHTPDISELQPKGFGILETAAPDGSRGMLGVFQLADPQNREVLVRLRGADIARDYAVTFDNARRTCRVSGYELANAGIHVRLDGAMTSELVLYEAINEAIGADEGAGSCR